ncbi:MAG: helix-turn-helix transcriptional regulator [Rhodobacteraceae bacterium]|jgi:phage repressor protein C with HTH and peptisase S24 domain|nr:helix-turn-helix transcriptional regulator [Paracoccaceae bacterium]
MANTPFATQVINEMNRRGWTMAELQRKSGVSYNIIAKLKQRPESSTKADPGRKLAAALGLRWNDALADDQDGDASQATPGKTQERASIPYTPIGQGDAPAIALAAVDVDTGSTAQVSIYDVHASAGYGALVSEEYIVDRLTFPLGYLQQLTSAHPRDLSIISVTGDSMEPLLRHKDVVMIDHTKTNLDWDGVFVLRFGDALHIKRVSRGTRGTVLILSENPAYPPREVPRDEIEVVGRVIWTGKKM